MFTIQRASNVQCASSRFARTKRTIYVGLTLKQCIALLPKEIEQHILEYLDAPNIFAIDRASMVVLQWVAHKYTQDPRPKIWQMTDKQQIVEYIQMLKIPDMETRIFAEAFHLTIHFLQLRLNQITAKRHIAELAARRKARIEQHAIANKERIYDGCLIRSRYNECGVVVARRENTMTVFISSSLRITWMDPTNVTIHAVLTGKYKIMSYKHCSVIAMSEFADDYALNPPPYTNITFYLNNKTENASLSEWKNSKIISRIKRNA